MQGPSEVTQLGHGITRIQAANPSPMTGTGTNSYLIEGPTGVVIIDPGPDLTVHLQAILTVAGDRRLAAILITHAHLDHTALVPRLAKQTGAPVLASGRADEGRSARMQHLAEAGFTLGGEGLDVAFTPDVRISHAERLQLAGLDLSVVATPGHLSGHLCFGLQDLLFTGDHVMGWSTSLVSPPDGDMGAYMTSLAALQHQSWQKFLPGHGPIISNPDARLSTLIAHRQGREAAILAALALFPTTARQLSQSIYTETPAALMPAAERNILAHLIDLQERNRVTSPDPLGLCARFQLI